MSNGVVGGGERYLPIICGSARVLKGKEGTQLRVPPRWESQRQSRKSTEMALILA